MRKLLSLVVLAGAAVAAYSQPAGVLNLPPERYGVAVNLDAFPQNTPKAALGSVIRAAEKGKTDYLAAHLLDPKFVDDRVAERASEYYAAAERDLRALRDVQRNDETIPRIRRLPDDPAAFAAAVGREAQARAFKVVAKDISANLAENPDRVRDLARFLRNGTVTEAGDAAKFTIVDVKDREVFLKKIGTQWVVEDRQVEPPAPPMPKN